jgi:hypothetical protein
MDVRSKEGITEDLLLMIKQEKDWELVGGIFATLRERPDVTPEMLEELKKPLNNILSKDPQSDMLNSSYAYGVIGLMSNFPTLENERFLLSILGEHEGFYDLGVIPSLGLIGTAESLPVMKKMLADFNYPSAGGGDVALSLESAIKSIEQKIATNKTQLDRKPERLDSKFVSDADTEMTSKKQIIDEGLKSSSNRNSLNPWLIWGGLVLGIVVVILYGTISKRASK